jgi:hypothetical protein
MFLLSILFRGSAFVAQPDRATGFEPVGWGFESLRTQTPGSLWDFATCIGILRDRRVNGCTPPGMRSADGSTQRRHRRRPSPFQQGSRGPFQLPPASCGRILLMCIFMQPCSQFEEGSKKSGAVIIHQIDQACLLHQATQFDQPAGARPAILHPLPSIAAGACQIKAITLHDQTWSCAILFAILQ